MNLPNILTLSRFVMTGFFIVYLQKEGLSASVIAFLIFCLAAVTDFLDGYIAKRYNLITNFGKILDPIADKFLMLSAFFVFARMNIIASWMFYVICFREVAVTLIRFYAMGKGAVLAAEKWGKYKTVFQIATAIIILLYLILYRIHQASPVEGFAETLLLKRYLIIGLLMTVTVILTLYSGISTLWNNRKVYLPYTK